MLWKNAWSGHYPKGSAVSKIGLYFLEELFRVFFISNEWCVPNKTFQVVPFLALFIQRFVNIKSKIKCTKESSWCNGYCIGLQSSSILTWGSFAFISCSKMGQKWDNLTSTIWNQAQYERSFDTLTEFLDCSTPNLYNTPWISVLTGFTAWTDFWHFLYHWKYQSMVLLSFEHLEKIRFFPKYGGCGSKIESAMPISILNL